MGSPEISYEEPLTPAGKLFVQPDTTQVIHLTLGGVEPLDVAFIKRELQNSVMTKHPRFASLLVASPNGGGEDYSWRRTEVDVDRHVIVVGGGEEDDHHLFSAEESEAAVSEYVAGLAVSSPLAADKPLWEFHVLVAHRSVVVRVHHALGDGVSLMSMLLSALRRADDPHALPVVFDGAAVKKGGAWFGMTEGWGVVDFLTAVWLTVVFVLEFVGRCLWVRDRKTVVSGGAGVELWPRKLVTARFWVEDMKAVKRAIPAATINDVLFGVVSHGLAKYLEHRSPKGYVEEGLQLTGLAMVNLREQHIVQDHMKSKSDNMRAGWGNKFGAILLPVEYHKIRNALDYVKRAKVMVDKKKHSFEAYFSYKIGDFIMSCFGPKYASWLNYRVVCNTSFSISNVVGPRDDVTLAGKPIAYMRVTTSTLPHAIIMHMLSYAGKAEMQILVAKDIIPDPEFLAKCFEDALLEMKQAAIATTEMI